MVNQIEYNNLAFKGNTITVYRIKHGWVAAKIIRVNKTTGTVRVRYSDKAEESHSRLTIKMD